MDRGLDPGVRRIVDADIDAALELSTAAGWNQVRADWERLVALEPEGCFGIDYDGPLVATATLVCHGTELAWVGMVLTNRDYQRRGLARRLVVVTLQLADARGIPCVKLDATDQGRPLYADLGFEDEQPIERWRREGAPVSSKAPRVAFDPALDREAFGADRSRFLAALGFTAERQGIRARYLGPYVSRDPAEAQRTIAAIVASREEPWFWDLFPSHPHAPRIARELGFEPVRRLVRMVRGSRIQTNDDLVYAIGGFEAG